MSSPVAAQYYSDTVHKVSDMGMQLLTKCGRRITYLGAELKHPWSSKELKDIDCFECIPSPSIFWVTREL